MTAPQIGCSEDGQQTLSSVLKFYVLTGLAISLGTEQGKIRANTRAKPAETAPHPVSSSFGNAACRVCIC